MIDWCFQEIIKILKILQNLIHKNIFIIITSIGELISYEKAVIFFLLFCLTGFSCIYLRNIHKIPYSFYWIIPIEYYINTFIIFIIMQPLKNLKTLNQSLTHSKYLNIPSSVFSARGERPILSQYNFSIYQYYFTLSI